MNYLSIAEARVRTGLRLVLTAGVPGPWGEAAKAVFAARDIAYLPVAQEAMAPNEDLRRWTGHRNAPIACLDDEPPLTGWLDIVLLAERLGRGPSLLPAEEAQRALCLGYITEIAGSDGFGWNRRHLVTAAHLGGGVEGPAELHDVLRGYALTEAAVARAPQRIATILGGLTEQLRRQQVAGSAYFIGDGPTALDIYWACFSLMVRPLPQAVNPMPDWLRPLYSACDPIVDAAIDPLLITHRDHMFAQHLSLPLDY